MTTRTAAHRGQRTTRLRGLVRGLAAAALLLLVGAHLAAASLAAECAARCRHSCCRVAAGAPSHCGHAAGRAAQCGLRGRCGHALESAITALPLLDVPSLASVPLPLGTEHGATVHRARLLGRADRVELPPPQHHA